ncbi:MAG: hypothetical protein ACPG06_00225 [Alphaproteobacteria bacterium]
MRGYTHIKGTHFADRRGGRKTAQLTLALALGLGLAACASNEPEMATLPAPQAKPLAAKGAPRVVTTVKSPNAQGAPTMAARPAGRTAQMPMVTMVPGAGLPEFIYSQSTVAPRVKEIRGEYDALVAGIGSRAQVLENVRGITRAEASKYHGTFAAIEARLQLGTTPGNPILVRQWNEAQGALSNYARQLMTLNTLSTSVAADSANAFYLKNKINATLNLVGALDEDHRQLHLMNDALDRVSLKVEKLLAEVTDEQARETNYIANQQANLTTLSLAIKNGELYGASLANRAYATSNVAGTGPRGEMPVSDPAAKPLIVIRFDRPDPDYEQALYTALAAALQRRPDAHFDLVAVSPSSVAGAQGELVKSESRRHASGVLRSVTDMGLPPNRLRISSASSARANESQVHIYVR